jgi:hypothetical protein
MQQTATSSGAGGILYPSTCRVQLLLAYVSVTNGMMDDPEVEVEVKRNGVS